MISDDEIRDSLEGAQLKFQRERGTDVTIFSPRASAMAHHIGDEAVSLAWSEQCNDLIARVCGLYPKNFVGVCQLPQSPGAPPAHSARELERCVNELGFIGCNLNPDPSGGHWTSPPLYDRHWYPLYEKMVELDVPAMVHVSASCNPASTPPARTTSTPTPPRSCSSSRAICSRTSRRCASSSRTAAARCRIHWGRYRGLAQDMKRPPLPEMMKNNVFFDTCVYHQPGIELLLEVVPHDNILFGSEMVGAVRGIDPETGHYFDDTKRYIDALGIDDATRDASCSKRTRGACIRGLAARLNAH